LRGAERRMAQRRLRGCATTATKANDEARVIRESRAFRAKTDDHAPRIEKAKVVDLPVDDGAPPEARRDLVEDHGDVRAEAKRLSCSLPILLALRSAESEVIVAREVPAAEAQDAAKRLRVVVELHLCEALEELGAKHLPGDVA